ncbi:MAG: phosphoribosylanthranilate isomerase [Methanoregula sp.]|nr:phosphoribosylanthranilate isomerase [Methanoregula sp.]
MRIKCCGITRVRDAQHADRMGADAIGVVLFSSASPRSVTVERAREIFCAVSPFTATVAVTHTRSDEELARILALRPTAIQIFHPFVFAEPPGVKVIRAVKPGDPLPDDCDAIVIDDSKGSGQLYDGSFARDAVQRSKVPVILAGGLTPENVGTAIRLVHPYAVDVATGIEQSPGIKDSEKIRAFIAACREEQDG